MEMIKLHFTYFEEDIFCIKLSETQFDEIAAENAKLDGSFSCARPHV